MRAPFRFQIPLCILPDTSRGLLLLLLVPARLGLALAEVKTGFSQAVTSGESLREGELYAPRFEDEGG